MGELRRWHFLVVDGAQEVRSLLRELLEESGYRVSVTAKAPAEPGEIDLAGIDLVILDPGPGGEDPGRQLLGGMGQDCVTAGIPVVVCTGDIRVVRGLTDHPDERNVGLVPKPFDIDDLLRVVDNRLGSSAVAR